jgi:serine/threonine protein kinase
VIGSFKEEYQVIKELGHGSFGCVVMARNRNSGVTTAVKIIRKQRMEKSDTHKKLLAQELEVCQQIDHPCIVSILEIIEDSISFYIVMEMLSEELAKRLKAKIVLNERDAAIVFQQILLALNYLHQKNIVHRDVKLENILMATDRKDDLTLKVTDFGFAMIFD